jgi:glutamine cyclotransferase
LGRGCSVLKLGWIALWASLLAPLGAMGATPEYGYRVVHTYPHDRSAFTEGLFYLDGYLYESTGEPGRSFVRKESLETGRVLQSTSIPPDLFGEGIVAWKDRLYELTWQTHVGFAYDLKTLKPFAQFAYPGEGWALTHDETRLIMSDGTPELRFLDPTTLKELGRIKVTSDDRPVASLNEIEYVKGEVYANIWMTNRIARIDPKTGHVLGWIDLTGLLPAAETPPGNDGVLNGIAYDAEHDRLFVTGKLWPKLFEIKLVPKAPRRGKAVAHG